MQTSESASLGMERSGHQRQWENHCTSMSGPRAWIMLENVERKVARPDWLNAPPISMSSEYPENPNLRARVCVCVCVCGCDNESVVQWAWTRVLVHGNDCALGRLCQR